MKLFTVEEVNAIADSIWNGCIDFHNNQGEGSVQYPDLDELKTRLIEKEKMSNLLEFHHNIAEKQKSIFSIETSELNPKKIKTEEIAATRETFDYEEYNLSALRQYILSHSSTLAESGNIVSGEVKGNIVVLTVLKRID